MGLNNVSPQSPILAAELESQLLSFMGDSKQIHFNLDGIFGPTVNELTEDGLQELLIDGAAGTFVERNITRWEFFTVWNQFKHKAKFYFGRQDVTNQVTQLLN